MTSEPATKADITEAIEELRNTDLAEIRQDLVEIRGTMATKQDLAEIRGTMATKQDLEAWGMMLLAEMRHTVNAAMEGVRDWMKAHAEQTTAAVAAANANTTQLRTDFEVHRDDAQVHRAARRRRT